MSTILFPRKGDRLRAHSVFFQAMRVAASGIGVTGGMAPSRASASSVAVASGTYRNGNAPGAYAGGSITSIPAASANMLRYDLIVFDVSDTTLKRIAGSEDTPTVIGEFLENAQPLPPELASTSQILLAVARVSSSGVENVNYGHYATGSVASMVVELPKPDSTATYFGATSKILARKTAGAGAGEECSLSEVLEFIGSAVQGDGIYRGASSWIRAPRSFDVTFPFGDGSAVLTAKAVSCRIPIASKIVGAYIRSLDTDGGLKSGSVTCSVYVHDLGGAIGSVVDTFTLSSASSMSETGLAITVAAGKWITVIISGISTVEQIVLSLSFEAT